MKTGDLRKNQLEVLFLLSWILPSVAQVVLILVTITIIIITIFEKFLVRAGGGGDIGMRAEPRLPTDKMHTFLTVCAINWWTLYLGLSTVHQRKGWRHWAWTVSGHKSSPNRWVVAYHLTFQKMKITILLKNKIPLLFSARQMLQ